MKMITYTFDKSKHIFGKYVRKFIKNVLTFEYAFDIMQT